MKIDGVPRTVKLESCTYTSTNTRLYKIHTVNMTLRQLGISNKKGSFPLIVRRAFFI